MTRIKSIAVVACVCMLFTIACKPDLTVYTYETEDGTANDIEYYIIKFQVKNIGSDGSNETYVHIDAINPDPPAGINEVRIRRQIDLKPLEPGDVEHMKCSFTVTELAAESVSLILIDVDPKNLVDETNETNNDESWLWPE